MCSGPTPSHNPDVFQLIKLIKYICHGNQDLVLQWRILTYTELSQSQGSKLCGYFSVIFAHLFTFFFFKNEKIMNEKTPSWVGMTEDMAMAHAIELFHWKTGVGDLPPATIMGDLAKAGQELATSQGYDIQTVPPLCDVPELFKMVSGTTDEYHEAMDTEKYSRIYKEEPTVSKVRIAPEQGYTTNLPGPSSAAAVDGSLGDLERNDTFSKGRGPNQTETPKLFDPAGLQPSLDSGDPESDEHSGSYPIDSLAKGDGWETDVAGPSTAPPDARPFLGSGVNGISTLPKEDNPESVFDVRRTSAVARYRLEKRRHRAHPYLANMKEAKEARM